MATFPNDLLVGDKFVSNSNTTKYDSFNYEVIKVLNNCYYVKCLDDPFSNAIYTWINKRDDITQV